MKHGEVDMPRVDDDAELKRFIYGNLTSMIIADGQLVWMRYNAMLTANSIVAAVLGVGIRNNHSALLLLATIFGLLLSWQWRGLTRRGWEVQRSYIEEARNFHWPTYRNALEAYGDWRAQSRGSRKKTDQIEIRALCVIRLFMGAYVLVAAYAGSIMFGLDWTILERALAAMSKLSLWR
jgi:hypothetical protein